MSFSFLVVEININFIEIKYCSFLESVKNILSQLFYAKRMQYEKVLRKCKQSSRAILLPCPNPKGCMSDSFEALSYFIK